MHSYISNDSTCKSHDRYYYDCILNFRSPDYGSGRSYHVFPPFVCLSLANADIQRHNDDSLNLPNFRHPHFFPRHVKRVNPTAQLSAVVRFNARVSPGLIPRSKKNVMFRERPAQSVITFNYSFSASSPR